MVKHLSYIWECYRLPIVFVHEIKQTNNLVSSSSPFNHNNYPMDIQWKEKRKTQNLNNSKVEYKIHLFTNSICQ